jgi:hypothetical protein
MLANKEKQKKFHQFEPVVIGLRANLPVDSSQLLELI